MNNDTLNLIPHIPEDHSVIWKPLLPHMNVISRLHHDDIANVVGGIESDQDLYDFCRLTGSWHAYVMLHKPTTRPIAFCVIEEVLPKQHILFHGGRVPDYNNTMLLYRGTAIMLKTLLDLNYKIDTTSTSLRSSRFMQALGFVKLNTDNGITHMQLTPETFSNSRFSIRMSLQQNAELQ